MMRGGTSKGAYFLASDLPADTAARDRVLLAVMGSPDPRQIDGIGGADPLTSKVGIVSKSSRPGVDVDYLFAQVFVDKALVGTAQNCGNILAGVGPFAIEQGLVRGTDPATQRDDPHGQQRPDRGRYRPNAGRRPHLRGRRAHRRRAGHGGADCALLHRCGGLHVRVAAADRARAIDEIDGVAVTLIDNGMPVVVMRAPTSAAPAPRAARRSMPTRSSRRASRRSASKPGR